MNEKNERNKRGFEWADSAKECAYIAVFVALVIAVQLAFSAVSGVELVTVLFVAYAFVFGKVRGMIAATAFALLRQLIFGFYAAVLVLYLFYYNLLAFTFGALGGRIKRPLVWLWLIVLIACVCTVLFTMIDNILTPLWYGYSERATKAYFYASFPIMIPQTVCAGISTALLFLPLRQAFLSVKRPLGARSRKKN